MKIKLALVVLLLIPSLIEVLLQCFDLMIFCQQITNIGRQKKDSENVEIDFVVIENATPLKAKAVVSNLDKISLTEMDQILGYTVSTTT